MEEGDCDSESKSNSETSSCDQSNLMVFKSTVNNNKKYKRTTSSISSAYKIVDFLELDEEVQLRILFSWESIQPS